MTLPELEDLTSYLNEHPPMHLMVASYLGIESSKPRRATKEDLMQLMGG